MSSLSLGLVRCRLVVGSDSDTRLDRGAGDGFDSITLQVGHALAVAGSARLLRADPGSTGGIALFTVRITAISAGSLSTPVLPS